MALSVARGVYKFIGVKSGQTVAGSETSGAAANLSLAATFGNFTLNATAHAPSTAAVGGLPIFPWWWSAYVAAELARQKASREARAVQIDDIFVVGPMPFATGKLEAEPARSAELVAVMRMPQVHAEAFVPRLVAVIEHDETVDDESAALLAAALLLAA
jgi:hypothetical protein